MKDLARRVVRTVGFGAVTGTLLPLYALRDTFASDADREAVRDAWTGRWSRALLRLFDVHVDLVGAPPPRVGRGARGRLVVMNHRSTIDIAVILSLFGGHVVSRADLSGWPVVGAAARRTGTIFVDRSSKSSGARALREITNLLREGEVVCVFPEGTTFPDDEVRTFHKGAFSAAARAGAEVLPVGIAYQTGSGAAFVGESFVAHLGRMSAASRTRAVVAIGEPFDAAASHRAAAGEHGAVAAAARAHAAVSTLVARARIAVDT